MGFPRFKCYYPTFLARMFDFWLNWVDEDDGEDEVGLKEKPEDTRYIKKITSNKTQSTGSVDKGLN